MRKFVKAVLVSGLIAGTHPAFAITECLVSVNSINVSDGGIFVTYVGGGSGTVSLPTDFKPMLSIIELAISLGKPITVRYAATGVACNSSTTQTIASVWLNP